MATKSPKRATYWASLKWTESSVACDLQTQFYPGIGSVYVVIHQEGRMVQQGGVAPDVLARQQVKHVKQLEAQGISVVRGPEKTYYDETGKGDWAEALECGHCQKTLPQGQAVSSCSGDSHERCRRKCRSCN